MILKRCLVSQISKNDIAYFRGNPDKTRGSLRKNEVGFKIINISIGVLFNAIQVDH